MPSAKPRVLATRPPQALDRNELFELMLELSGGFGRQQWSLAAVGLIVCFLAAMNHLGTIFIAFAPKFKCAEDG